jgi:hypothetical protein
VAISAATTGSAKALEADVSSPSGVAGEFGSSAAGATLIKAEFGPSGSRSSVFTVDTGGNVWANGNVGIGTTTPAQKLVVSGNLNITGAGNAIIFPDGTVQATAGTGAGGGTITGVTAGTGLSGGGTAGNVTLSLAIGSVNGVMEFLSSGTFTVPPNITHLMIEMWGGGGSGSTPSGCSGGDGSGMAAGGGGAYTRTVITVVPGATYGITVGAGGAAGGGNGGTSEIEDPSSNVLAFAGGGQAGQSNGTAGAGGLADATAMISHAGSVGLTGCCFPYPGSAYAYNLAPSGVSGIAIGSGGSAGCSGTGGNTPISEPGGPGYVLITW